MSALLNATPLRVGIAGLGRLGKRHAETLIHTTRGARLVSACSPLAEERNWARQTLGIETSHDATGSNCAGQRIGGKSARFTPEHIAGELVQQNQQS